MKIKPVLVPDHNAADLRALMDHFATAAQSATPAAQANQIRQQLTESAEPGMAEGSGMYGDEEVSWEKGGRRAPTGAFRNPAVVKTNKSIGTRVSDIGAGGKEYNVKTDKEWDKQSGVSEARPDVMRHKGDTTVKIVKRGGKPIGEIGTDSEASAGNGQYYVKLYDGSYDAVGFDSAEEALAELKAAVKSSVTEGVAESIDPIAQLRADILRFAR
jgi:hypothetical protein